MAAKPPEGSHGQNATNPNALLDFDEGEPYYSSGEPPPVSDDRILYSYDIDDSEIPQHRPSTSYDEFVGAQAPNMGSHVGSTTAAYEQPQAPYLRSGAGFSQTSGLNNYQRYSDIDDLPEDGNGYYQMGRDEPDTPGIGMISGGRMRNRNSAMLMGGGLLGRAKVALGMGPKYSEMDLPLTEPGQRPMSDAEPSKERSRKHDTSNFKFGFGRGKPDPSTLGPRIIHLNNPPANAVNRWVDNHISTAKYNVATFLPKFIFEQFSKYANLFFLFTAILQQIPNISPTNTWTTIVPLCIVLLTSAIKELVEDHKRKVTDRSLNHSQAKVLRGNSFETAKWVDIAVGDIVRVESEEPFPADLVLLASSEPEGLCYIETANLDGETNLKIKQAIPETANLHNPGELSRLTGRMRSEQPNSSLYTYEATLTMQAGGGEKELPLAPDQLLLRGAVLRNTNWIHGVVVFTGHETKLMRNATATPIKRTAVERQLNIQILMLVAILILLSIISTIGDLVTRNNDASQLVYLMIDFSTPTVVQFFSDLATYWVLYSNLVPISLFVTIEIVKYYHAFLINSDLDMYHDDTDTPAVCRTSSLVEELGQIDYIFSDKTGTLTCNQMEFKQCTIAGIQYAEEVPDDKRAVAGGPGLNDFGRLRENLKTDETRDVIHNFLALLATCHTVIPERRDDSSEIKYQAASPDEGALVQGALSLGYRFVARKPRAVKIEAHGVELEYELLAVLEFNSTRKRMSTIFRCPDGKIRVYCKGADTVILERLGPENPIVDVTLQQLEEYATEGLRTLCLAMREVPEQEFQEWFQVFEKASTTVGGNRADEVDKAAELIEHDLYLLGATAIEDRLQEGVPETIATLQTAGIKVWVLTGDRQETAINIGMSCKLISEDMTLLIVNENSPQATRDNISKKLNVVQNHASGMVERETMALIIDGKSLTYALEKDLEKMFLDLAINCKAVICWYFLFSRVLNSSLIRYSRVSPLQKALVVKLVKRHSKSLLLAIGDGANDVSMIQAAHVGVGISGVEGLQAARSADVAIGQFRFLRKLLLVHGAWSYQRISKVILYSFYKNIALYMTQFWVKSFVLECKRWLTVQVFLSKRLFWRSDLRILDPDLLQRPLHRPSPIRHGYFRPVHLRPAPRPLPATLPAWAKGSLFQNALLLPLDRKRLLPLLGRLHRLGVHHLLGHASADGLDRGPLACRHGPLWRRLGNGPR